MDCERSRTIRDRRVVASATHEGYMRRLRPAKSPELHERDVTRLNPMRASPRTVSFVAVLTCALTLWLGYLNKARCVGAPFDAEGRSMRFQEIKDAQVCYSDIQELWLGRGINLHWFPFIDGGIT